MPALVPALPRAPESEARAAHRERRLTRKRAAAGGVRHGPRAGHERAPLDPEDALLVLVLQCSFPMMETIARRLHRKNSKALRLAIELSEHEETTEAATKTKVARHAKEHDCLLRRLTSQISFDDDSNVTDISSSDDDAPSVARCLQGVTTPPATLRGRGRQGNGDFLHTSLFYLCF